LDNSKKYKVFRGYVELHIRTWGIYTRMAHPPPALRRLFLFQNLVLDSFLISFYVKLIIFVTL
jgi:hypothetical protein